MSKNVNQSAIEQATKNVKALPESTQFAIVTVLPNIVNGAFWGFCQIDDARKYAGALRNDKNITLRKLTDGVIVEVAPDYILTAMSYVDANAITPKNIEEMKEGISKACAVFDKFLMKNANKGFSGYIGIYCVNDVPSIVYKGTTFPAFRLPIGQVMTYLAKYGYSIVTKGGVIKTEGGINSTMLAEVWDSMILSPTNTGCFLKIQK